MSVCSDFLFSVHISIFHQTRTDGKISTPLSVRKSIESCLGVLLSLQICAFNENRNVNADEKK